MQVAEDNTYRQVQGLRRGLSILKALNDESGSAATPRILSERTALNRTTVKRILETLALDGYVRHNDAEGSYSLAPEVLSLSRGLSDGALLMDARLLQCAAPVLDSLVRETGWCVSLATVQDGCMLLRKTTHSYSDMSGEAEMRKFHRLPMLFSAIGRAYLTDCQDDERQTILERLQAHRDQQLPIAKNPRLVQLITQRVRDQGYAIQDGDWPGEKRYGAVATSVRCRDGKTVASMSVVYVREAVSRAKIIEEFVPKLKLCASKLAAAL